MNTATKDLTAPMPPVDSMGVLAVLGQEPHDADVLEAASAFAPVGVRWQALLPVPLPERVPCPWGELPEAALAVDHQARRGGAEAHLGMMRRSLLRLHAEAECGSFECADKRLEASVQYRARLAGLIVTGVPPEMDGEMPVAARWFARLLTESGRPTLVVPRRAALTQPPRRALVAWSDTPQASRALHEALLWLPAACTLRIVLAMGAGETRAVRESAAGAVALIAHIQRHHRTATFEVVDSQGRPPEDVLLDEVRLMAADMIVMGAYGHARSLEFVFGGVTLNLLHRSRVPLFMAH